MYIISCYHTASPVFFSSFTTIPHRYQAFLRFWYRVAQSLLLYANVCPRYRKDYVGSIGSEFTITTTLLASKQCCRVYCRLCCSSPRRFLSESKRRSIRRSGGAWLPYRSYLGKGRCSSSILKISPQCFRLKLFWRPFQVQDHSELPGKGHWHWGLPFRNLTPNTWGRSSV